MSSHLSIFNLATTPSNLVDIRTAILSRISINEPNRLAKLDQMIHKVIDVLIKQIPSSVLPTKTGDDWAHLVSKRVTNYLIQQLSDTYPELVIKQSQSQYREWISIPDPRYSRERVSLVPLSGAYGNN